MNSCTSAATSLAGHSINQSTFTTFQLLRPTCVAVASSPTVHNLCALQDVCKSVPITDIMELEEYIFVPLRVLLKKQTHATDERLLCCCLETVQLLLKEAGFCCSDATFVDMFSQLFLLLDHPTQPQKLDQSCAVYQLAVLRAICDLLGSAKDKLQRFVLSTHVPNIHSPGSYLPIIGHAVFVLMKLAESKRTTELKLCALECLTSLLKQNNPANVSDNDDCLKRLADTCASFLPGVCVGLCNVISASSIVNHRIICLSSEVLFAVVFNSLRDDIYENNGSAQQQNLEDDSKQIGGYRDSEWLKHSTEKLLPLITKVQAVMSSHSNADVRRALLNDVPTLITSCSRNLSATMSFSVDTLLTLSEDEDYEISRLANQSLGTSDNPDSNNSIRQLVLPVAEANLYPLCAKLPTIVRIHQDERQTLAVLKLMRAYIRIMGRTGIEAMLLALWRIEKFLMAFCQILEHDRKRLPLVSEIACTCTDFEVTLIKEDPKMEVSVADMYRQLRPYKYLNSNCAKIVEEILFTVSSAGQLSTLSDTLLSWLRHSTTKTSAVAVLNTVMLGCSGRVQELDSMCNICAVNSVAEEYLCHLQEELTGLPALPEDIQQESASELQADRSLLMSLLLQGLGNCALILVAIPKQLNDLMLKSLCLVLDCFASSQNVLVKDSAFLCLKLFVAANGLQRFEELIDLHMDYLTHTLTMHFRHFSLFKRSALVLISIIELGPAIILPKLKPLIYELMQTVDAHYMERNLLFLKVFAVLTRALATVWFEAMGKIEDEKEHLYVNYAPNSASSELENEDTITQGLQPSKERVLPLAAQITVDIIKRTKHFLSLSILSIRLIAMDIILFALRALREREDDLLPMIHETWSGLACRFCDNLLATTTRRGTTYDLTSNRKAFEVILLTAQISSSFVYRRILEDVLPLLQCFLLSQSKSSFKSGPIYQQCSAYKLQLCLLEHCGELCELIELQETESLELMKVCAQYFQMEQPTPLRNASIDSVCKILKIMCHDSIESVNNILHEIRCYLDNCNSTNYESAFDKFESCLSKIER